MAPWTPPPSAAPLHSYGHPGDLPARRGPGLVSSGDSLLAVISAGRRDRAPARMPALPGSDEWSGERRPEGAALNVSIR